MSDPIAELRAALAQPPWFTSIDRKLGERVLTAIDRLTAERDALRGELAEERANMAATMEGWEKLCEKLDEQDGTIAALQGEVERLTRELDHWKDAAAATQMLAHKWSAAHDALLGWIQDWPEGIKRLQQLPAKYEYPAPVNLPNALVRAEQAEAEVERLTQELDAARNLSDWGDRLQQEKIEQAEARTAKLEAVLRQVYRMVDNYTDRDEITAYIRAALAPATEAGE